MDSAAVLAHLNSWHPELIAEIGIDPAMLVTAVEAVYAADSSLDSAWANPLAEYFLYKRALSAFSVDFDVSLEGDSYRLSQRRAGLQAAYDAAFANVSWIVEPDADGYGVPITVTSHFMTGGAAW